MQTDPADTPTCPPGAHPAPAEDTLPTALALEAAAAMLHAAGEPARLRLLLRLAEGPRCVSELAEAEGDKVATISARLKLLHAARLVSRRRAAKHVYYALQDDHVLSLLHDVIAHANEDRNA